MANLLDKDKLACNFPRYLNWEEKHPYVIELGAKPPALNDTERQPGNLISDCQSQVWIFMSSDEQGRVEFHGDSDTAIVKGLLTVVFILYRSLTPQQVVDLDVQLLFGELALSQHLTPS